MDIDYSNCEGCTKNNHTLNGCGIFDNSGCMFKKVDEETYTDDKTSTSSAFDVFEDRAKSLLKRWRLFYDKHPNDECINQACITGFLNEVNDEFTNNLLEVKEIKEINKSMQIARTVEIYSKGEWVLYDFDALKKGQVFRLIEPTGKLVRYKGHTVMIAKDDARKGIINSDVYHGEDSEKFENE